LDIEELESFRTFPESGQPKEGVDSEDLTVMDVSEPDENDVMEDEKQDDWNIVLNKFGSLISSLLPQVELDCSNLKSNLSKCQKYVELLEIYCSSKKSLANALQEISKVSSQLGGLDLNTHSKQVDNRDEAFKACKSVHDIISKFPEFEFNDEKHAVVCIVCHQEFQYHQEFDSKSEEVSTNLKGLKFSLKRHMGRQVHLDKVADQESKDLM